MTDELNTYLQNLEFKEKSGTRYYFDITGKKYDKKSDAIFSLPIVSIKQKGRNATGSKLLLDCINHASQSGCQSIEVKEYASFDQEAEPILIQDFPIKSTKRNTKKSQEELVHNQQQQMGNIFGQGTALQGIDSMMSMLGIGGGLQGLIQRTADNITIQDRYADAKDAIQKLENSKTALENKIEKQKEEIESLKDRLKEAKDDYKDLQRDYDFKREKLENKAGLGSLFMNSLVGYVAKKTNFDATLGDLLGSEMGGTATAPAAANVDTSGMSQIDDTTANFYANIDVYYKSLNAADLEKFATIIQYLSIDTNNINTLLSVVQKLYTKQLSQQNNGISENNNQQGQ